MSEDRQEPTATVTSVEETGAVEAVAEASTAGESAAPTSGAPHREATRQSGGGLAWLALIAAAALGAAGAYGWQRIEARFGALERQVETTETRAAQAIERLADTTRNEDRIDARLAELQSAQQSAQQRLDEVSMSVAQVQALVAQGESGFRIAEALHLQRLANERLRLAGDLDGASAALSAADGLLARLADPALLPVREQLAVELAALRAVERPDIAGAALRIQQLIAALDTLPVRPSGEGDAASPVAGDETAVAPWWERTLDRILGEIGRHVTVRRQARLERADAETALYLRRMIALRLEAARVALIRRDGNGYQATLDAALTMIDGHFEPEAAARLRGEIEDLRRLRPQTDLPDISASHDLLSSLTDRAPHAGDER